MAFHGKVALITGAASGMGRMSALRLANQGAKVAAVDLNEEALQAVAKENKNITPFTCDISDYESVKSVIADVQEKLGPIDRVTHAAAIMPLALLKDMPVEKMVQLMRINYEGTLFITKTILPDMLERNTGDMISFGSIAGDVPLPLAGSYCATKAATNAYMKQLIKENQKSNVRFLLVCPPPVNTPLLDAKNTGVHMDFEKAKKQGMVVEPEFILDSIEQGLEKGKQFIYPGLAAKIPVLIYKLLPEIFWKLSLNSAKVEDAPAIKQQKATES